MILIQSDMFKALWFMIYAIAALTPGSIGSTSIFCQISGFFTAVGVELSGMRTLLGPSHCILTVVDFAVLMIAIHNALYIFNPPTSIGEGGLYPYRYIAYVLWIALPLLMASLAFINPNGAYVSGGTSCHLPVRPFWYQLALSWIPRYLIFILILGIDASIYLHVIHKFGDIGNDHDTSEHPSRTQDSTEGRQEEYRPGKCSRTYDVPPIPALAYNGLTPETIQSSIVSCNAQDFLVSKPRKYRSKAIRNILTLRRPKLNFQRHFRKANTFSDMVSSVPLTSDVVAAFDPHTLERTATASTPAAVLTPLPGLLPSAQTSWTTFAARFNTRPPSKVSVRSFLRDTERNVSFSSSASAPLQQLELVDPEGRNLNEISLIHTRGKIQQQLRFIFVYPLAYMAMWVLPFVSHALQYNDYYAANPPFVLSALITIIITSQSAVDCWIFNIKEKPWRQFAEKRESLAQGLVCLRCVTFGRTRSSQCGRGGGKSKGVMDAEARFAYQRRTDERAARASEIDSAGRSERRERSWWDEIEDTEDEPPERMSPLAESNVVDLDGQLASADDAVRQLQEDTEINRKPGAWTVT